MLWKFSNDWHMDSLIYLSALVQSTHLNGCESHDAATSGARLKGSTRLSKSQRGPAIALSALAQTLSHKQQQRQQNS